MYVFDVDGTLTNSKYGFAPTGKESVNKEVVATLSRFIKQWSKVVILTGRESKYRRVTENWLKSNWIQYDSLFMRNDEHIGSTAYKKDKMKRLMIPGRKIQGWYDDNPWVQKIAEELNVPFTLVR